MRTLIHMTFYAKPSTSQRKKNDRFEDHRSYFLPHRIDLMRKIKHAFCYVFVILFLDQL